MSVNNSEQTVLIVEDEEDIRETFEHYLSEAEYDIETVATGGEALIRLRGDIDIALLDRRLPGISGDEVLENIIDINPECRVVVVSAIDPKGSLSTIGCDDYLTKPASKEELLDTIEQQLLFDKYQDVLCAYHEATKRQAMLESHLSEHDDVVEEAAAERERLRGELNEIVESFPDDRLKEMVPDL